MLKCCFLTSFLLHLHCCLPQELNTMNLFYLLGEYCFAYKLEQYLQIHTENINCSHLFCILPYICSSGPCQLQQEIQSFKLKEEFFCFLQLAHGERKTLLRVRQELRHGIKAVSLKIDLWCLMCYLTEYSILLSLKHIACMHFLLPLQVRGTLWQILGDELKVLIIFITWRPASLNNECQSDSHHDSFYFLFLFQFLICQDNQA